MTKLCPSCGFDKIPIHLRYCQRCGYDVEAAKAQSAAPPPAHNPALRYPGHPPAATTGPSSSHPPAPHYPSAQHSQAYSPATALPPSQAQPQSHYRPVDAYTAYEQEHEQHPALSPHYPGHYHQQTSSPAASSSSSSAYGTGSHHAQGGSARVHSNPYGASPYEQTHDAYASTSSSSPASISAGAAAAAAGPTSGTGAPPRVNRTAKPSSAPSFSATPELAQPVGRPTSSYAPPPSRPQSMLVSADYSSSSEELSSFHSANTTVTPMLDRANKPPSISRSNKPALRPTSSYVHPSSTAVESTARPLSSMASLPQYGSHTAEVAVVDGGGGRGETEADEAEADGAERWSHSASPRGSVSPQLHAYQDRITPILAPSSYATYPPDRSSAAPDEMIQEELRRVAERQAELERKQRAQDEYLRRVEQERREAERERDLLREQAERAKDQARRQAETALQARREADRLRSATQQQHERGHARSHSQVALSKKQNKPLPRPGQQPTRAPKPFGIAPLNPDGRAPASRPPPARVSGLAAKRDRPIPRPPTQRNRLRRSRSIGSLTEMSELLQRDRALSATPPSRPFAGDLAQYPPAHSSTTTTADAAAPAHVQAPPPQVKSQLSRTQISIRSRANRRMYHRSRSVGSLKEMSELVQSDGEQTRRQELRPLSPSITARAPARRSPAGSTNPPRTTTTTTTTTQQLVARTPEDMFAARSVAQPPPPSRPSAPSPSAPPVVLTRPMTVTVSSPPPSASSSSQAAITRPSATPTSQSSTPSTPSAATATRTTPTVAAAHTSRTPASTTSSSAAAPVRPARPAHAAPSKPPEIVARSGSPAKRKSKLSDSLGSLPARPQQRPPLRQPPSRQPPTATNTSSTSTSSTSNGTVTPSLSASFAAVADRPPARSPPTLDDQPPSRLPPTLQPDSQQRQSDIDQPPQRTPPSKTASLEALPARPRNMPPRRPPPSKQ